MLMSAALGRRMDGCGWCHDRRKVEARDSKLWKTEGLLPSGQEEQVQTDQKIRRREDCSPEVQVSVMARKGTKNGFTGISSRREGRQAA